MKLNIKECIPGRKFIMKDISCEQHGEMGQWRTDLMGKALTIKGTDKYCGDSSWGIYIEEYPGWRIPYLRIKEDWVSLTWLSDLDPMKCYCLGPSISKWCFDSNKMENVCAKCRKRK